METYKYIPKKVKFRGKSIARPNEWVYGYLMSFTKTKNGESSKLFAIGDDWAFETVLPETIGQSTNIKSSEGKLIYEGDIIIGKGFNDWYEEMENRFIVKPFDQMKTSFRDWFHFSIPEFEIIGNVFDNPDLAYEIALESQRYEIFE